MCAFKNHNGRETLKQNVTTIRRNNPDILAGFGEFMDNSVSWGRASHGSITIRETSIIITDNGTFNRSRLPFAFEKFKSNSMNDEFYNQEDILGKFNFGLTESVFLLGDKAKIICKFGDEYQSTCIDVDECIERNGIYPDNSKPTEKDISNFNKYHSKFEEYTDSLENGTMLIIENLQKKWKKDDFDKIRKFVFGLYSTKCHNQTTWLLYDMTDLENEESPLSISPNDLTFGCQPIESLIINVYENENKGVKYYTREIRPKLKKLYSFNVYVYFFDDKHTELEKKVFGSDLSTGDRAGFMVRRGGRLVTGIVPKMWNLKGGETRGKGLRIFIDLPANANSDDDWNIGTFKKVSDDNWIYFNKYLQDFITVTFKDFNAMKTKRIKEEQKKLENIYKDKMNNIPKNKTIEQLLTMIKEETEKRDKYIQEKNQIMPRRSGNLYKTVNQYIEKLKQTINLKKEKENPVSPTPPEQLIPENGGKKISFKVARTLDKEFNSSGKDINTNTKLNHNIVNSFEVTESDQAGYKEDTNTSFVRSGAPSPAPEVPEPESVTEVPKPESVTEVPKPESVTEVPKPKSVTEEPKPEPAPEVPSPEPELKMIPSNEAIIMLNNATNLIKQEIEKMSVISEDKVNKLVELIKTAHIEIQ